MPRRTTCSAMRVSDAGFSAPSTSPNGSGDGGPVEHVLAFGSDLSNYYPNRGLKVYKPRGSVLRTIANYRDPDRHTDDDSRPDTLVPVGAVRYASTNRPFQRIGDVRVAITPADLLAPEVGPVRDDAYRQVEHDEDHPQVDVRTPLAGQAAASRPDRLRPERRVRQREPAGQGPQAQPERHQERLGMRAVAAARKSSGRTLSRTGSFPTPTIPIAVSCSSTSTSTRNLEIGKQIVDAALAGDNSIYIKNFRDVRLEAPDPADRSAMTRHNRRVLFYRALLFKAGLTPPPTLNPATRGLFKAELVEAMAQSEGKTSAAATSTTPPPPSFARTATRGPRSFR